MTEIPAAVVRLMTGRCERHQRDLRIPRSRDGMESPLDAWRCPHLYALRDCCENSWVLTVPEPDSAS